MGVGPRTMSLSTLCSREDVYCSLEIVLGRTMYLLGQKRKPRHIAALCSITPDTKKVPPTASRTFSPEAARMIFVKKPMWCQSWIGLLSHHTHHVFLAVQHWGSFQFNLGHKCNLPWTSSHRQCLLYIQRQSRSLCLSSQSSCPGVAAFTITDTKIQSSPAPRTCSNPSPYYPSQHTASPARYPWHPWGPTQWEHARRTCRNLPRCGGGSCSM